MLFRSVEKIADRAQDIHKQHPEYVQLHASVQLQQHATAFGTPVQVEVSAVEPQQLALVAAAAAAHKPALGASATASDSKAPSSPSKLHREDTPTEQGAGASQRAAGVDSETSPSLNEEDSLMMGGAQADFIPDEFLAMTEALERQMIRAKEWVADQDNRMHELGKGVKEWDAQLVAALDDFDQAAQEMIDARGLADSFEKYTVVIERVKQLRAVSTKKPKLS